MTDSLSSSQSVAPDCPALAPSHSDEYDDFRVYLVAVSRRTNVMDLPVRSLVSVFRVREEAEAQAKAQGGHVVALPYYDGVPRFLPDEKPVATRYTLFAPGPGEEVDTVSDLGHAAWMSLPPEKRGSVVAVAAFYADDAEHARAVWEILKPLELRAPESHAQLSEEHVTRMRVFAQKLMDGDKDAIDAWNRFGSGTIDSTMNLHRYAMSTHQGTAAASSTAPFARYWVVCFHPDPRTHWRIPIAVVVETERWVRVGVASFLPDADALGGEGRLTLLRAGLKILSEWGGGVHPFAGSLPDALGPHFALSDEPANAIIKEDRFQVSWVIRTVLPTRKFDVPRPSADVVAADLAKMTWESLPSHLQAELQHLYAETGEPWRGDPHLADELRALGVHGPWAQFVAREGGGVR